MPNRYLRAGIKDSKGWNACDWIAQSGYIRLLTAVDDYGRYEADPLLLKGHLFARRPEVDIDAIMAIRKDWVAQKLVVIYEVNGTEYLQVTKWQERVRSKSKFPDPPADICQQLPATCGQMHASPALRPRLTPPTFGQAQVSPSVQAINYRTELDRVESRIKAIRTSCDSHQDLTPADKTELKALKARQCELKASLGFEV